MTIGGKSYNGTALLLRRVLDSEVRHKLGSLVPLLRHVVRHPFARPHSPTLVQRLRRPFRLFPISNQPPFRVLVVLLAPLLPLVRCRHDAHQTLPQLHARHLTLLHVPIGPAGEVHPVLAAVVRGHVHRYEFIVVRVHRQNPAFLGLHGD